MLFCDLRYPHNEFCFPSRVSNPVVWIVASQSQFQSFIFFGRLRVVNQIIPKEQPVPVFKVTLDHVNMMGTNAGRVSLDEPGVKRRATFSMRCSPKILIPFSLQDRRDSRFRFLQRTHFHEQVDNWFCRQAGNCGAPKVLDAPDQILGQTVQEVFFSSSNIRGQAGSYGTTETFSCNTRLMRSSRVSIRSTQKQH